MQDRGAGFVERVRHVGPARFLHTCFLCLNTPIIQKNACVKDSMTSDAGMMQLKYYSSEEVQDELYSHLLAFAKHTIAVKFDKIDMFIGLRW